jgi:hypothetical protein
MKYISEKLGGTFIWFRIASSPAFVNKVMTFRFCNRSEIS